MTAPSPAPIPTFDLVPFEGADIMAARWNEGGRDQVYVPMKKFCGSLGLPWDGARRRIERDEILREGAVMMTVPSPGGAQLQQTLPLDLIPGFLMGAESSRYAPELRERIKAYRRACYGVLYRHFYGVPTEQPAPALPPPIAPAALPASHGAVSNALELVALLRTERPGPVRTFYHALLDETCRQLGQDAPLVAILPGDGPTVSDRFDALLTGLQTLDRRDVDYNHLGDDAHGRFALNLPELRRIFARHDIDVAIDDALLAAFETGDHRYRVVVRAIDSRIGRRAKATFCHVIERQL